MGFLSNLVSGVKKTLGVIGNLNPITLALNPLSGFRKSAEIVTGTTIKPSKIETINTIIEGAAVGTVLGAVIAGPVGAIKGGSIGFGLGTTQSLLDISPKLSTKVQEVVVAAPSNFSNFVQNVGTEIETPTLEGAMKILKENPFLTAGTAVAFLGALGFSSILIAQAVKNYFKDDKVTVNVPEDKNNSSGETTINNYYPTEPVQAAVVPTTPAVLPTNEETPITPETTTITTGQKKRYRRAKAKEMQKISQRVNVIVSNRSSSVGIKNQRYLNERMYN
jgi:hypothetical protein